MDIVNREHWLQSASDAMRPWFEKRGYPLPDDIKYSCGWPKGGTHNTIGQCFYKLNVVQQSAPGAAHNIFISPSQDDPVRVLDILLHEDIHVVAGHEAGHKGLFKTLALDFGLKGKMTHTVAEPGSPLHNDLVSLSERLGPYPHAALAPMVRLTKPSPWVRLMSPSDDSYTVVISQKSIDRSGPPLDPEGEAMVLKE